jgi:uncharacterized protein (DUF58 family)
MTTEGGSPQQELHWELSRHARRLLTLAFAGLLIAVITRRPEFAGVAAPALLLLSGRRAARPEQVGVQVRASAAKAYEGERAAIDVAVTGHGEHSVELIFHPAAEVEAVPLRDGNATRAAGSRARFGFTMKRWGRRRVGTLDVLLRDRWRLFEGRCSVTLPHLDCYPKPAQQQTRVVLSRLPNRLGEHTARAPGEGIEFAGLREYVPGDRQRRINWPASTRRGRLLVNTYAAERSQEVVLLVDATSDVGEPGSSAVDIALRGATATARAYLAVRDRVGFIAYQWGGVHWLTPGLGQRQVYRIIDSMLDAQSRWMPGEGFRRLPRPALPHGALVIAFSPLLDQKFVEALRDMRERGFAILVIDVLNVEPQAGMAGVDRLARRIWRMEQHAIRFSLRELGVPVVHWDGQETLDIPLAAYRRRPLVAHR